MGAEASRAVYELLVEVTVPLDDEIDEVALLHQIEEDFRDQPPLSETILQDRREGP